MRYRHPTIVDIHDNLTNYSLRGSVNQEGELVLSGSDLSPSVKAMFGKHATFRAS